MKVLITGGSRGIGEACVRLFCKNGDRVAFLYRSDTAAAERISTDTGALAIRADVSDPEAVKKAVEEAVRALGGIDVLVNNAGIAQIKLFTEISDSDWSRMIDTNLGGAFYVSREVAKRMIAKQSGSIVNIGSMWGKTGASCEVHYSASKAALCGFTKALAKELAPSGICVNCVCPGVIETDMNSMIDSETKAALCEEIPIMRMGTAEEIAQSVFFLASSGADYITGQILGVNGGMVI